MYEKNWKEFFLNQNEARRSNFYKNKCKGITNTPPFIKVSEPVSLANQPATNKPWNSQAWRGFQTQVYGHGINCPTWYIRTTMIGNSAKTLSEFTALGIVICRNKIEWKRIMNIEPLNDKLAMLFRISLSYYFEWQGVNQACSPSTQLCIADLK